MKIPTILGLALLITAISLGFMIYSSNQNLERENQALVEPKNVQAANISDTQTTIIWTTDTPSVQKVIFGKNLYPNQVLSDDRDGISPKPRLSHFVTLKNLEPDSQYNFKIKDSSFTYPTNNLTFKTAPVLPSSTKDAIFLPALRGIIIQGNLAPADDSLITLATNGSSTIASFSSSSGNFILPLINLRTSDLKTLYPLKDPIDATLTVKKEQSESKVQLKIPFESQILPPISLGQNLDLRNYQPKPEVKNPENSEFDLNADGIVNSLDLGILTQNITKKTKDTKFDFNQDNAVDTKDSDLLKAALQ